MIYIVTLLLALNTLMIYLAPKSNEWVLWLDGKNEKRHRSSESNISETDYELRNLRVKINALSDALVDSSMVLMALSGVADWCVQADPDVDAREIMARLSQELDNLLESRRNREPDIVSGGWIENRVKTLDEVEVTPSVSVVLIEKEDG